MILIPTEHFFLMLRMTINGGIYKTYILLKQEKDITEVSGILRYGQKNLDDLKAELESCEYIQVNISEIERLFKRKNYIIVYLSRVGVSENQQNKHLSHVILNFFDYYMFELKKNIFIYTKVRMGSSKFLGPLYRIIASNQDSHWGNFSICVRSINLT